MPGLVPALLALLLAGGATEAAALLDQLRHGDAEARREAAVRLGEAGERAAIDDLARALHDPVPAVRAAAQDALWAIWHRSGRPEIDARLQEGILLMEQGQYPAAVEVFDEVIARAPEFAEGWNKRATVYYLMGEYDRSLADCAEVLRRNPIHFGALAGVGLNHLRKGELEPALRAFERALAVNPNLAQIRRLLEELREEVRARRRDTI